MTTILVLFISAVLFATTILTIVIVEQIKTKVTSLNETDDELAHDRSDDV